MDITEPIYSEDYMDEALLSPFQTYEKLTEKYVPDVIMPLGAPNKDEELIRYAGAESDVLHNLNRGNDLDGTIFLIPSDMSVDEGFLTSELEDHGVVFQYTDELYTTFDDWKAVEDITSNNDRIHGHTSDYHAKKAHVTGWSLLDFLDNRDVQTFGFKTERNEREDFWKHNDVVQSLDSFRQLYYVAKDRTKL